MQMPASRRSGAGQSHGAHVTDVFAGRVPTSSRIGQNRLDPPTWKAGTTLLASPTWCSCNFPRTVSVIRPAYGSKLMLSTASGTSCHVPARNTSKP